ncbi:VirB4 family type IV secretion system protein [Bacillus paramycoides]|uniref:VirB4 family type IV secretion system protein n=1 Tax=Bacillus paramycoides TaxID=2026194 RepID=UPI002E1E64FA|nr:DUF87 domain-containing protein [Bacillus paramycoides]
MKLTSLLKRNKKDDSIDYMIQSNNVFLELLSPDSVEETQDYIRLGSNYVRTLAVAYFATDIYAGFLDKLHSLEGNISIIHHIKPTSAEHTLKYLDKAIRELESRLDEKGLPGRYKKKYESDLKDAHLLQDKLTNGDSELFFENMLIHVTASSKDELDHITHIVKTQTSEKMKVITPNFKMMDAFYSVLPLASIKIEDMTYRNFDAESLSALFPFSESEIFSEKGTIKGRNIKTQSIVIVDEHKLVNRNSFVVGTSGSGKSTYLFTDMIRKWIRGSKIRVIDPKLDYGRIFKRLGGEWIKISPQSEKRINPFEVLNTSVDEGNQQSLLHQKISNLKGMFTIMYKDLKDQQVEQALLGKVLVQVYAEKYNITWDTDFSMKEPEDFPILGDLYKKIAELIKENPDEYGALTKFYQVLYPYVEGEYSKAFNGHTNVDLSNDLIAFDIFDLVQLDQDELGKVAMFNVLTYLKDDALKDKESKHIYVDEAHVLADPNNPLAMKFLFNMYKLIRSFNGGVTSATQEVDDFLSARDGNRNYGAAIMYNSSTKLYLAMTEQSFESLKVKASESFSEEEKNILVMKDANKHKHAGKGIFIVGSTRVALEVEMTKEELKLWDEERYYNTYRHEKRKIVNKEPELVG